MILRRLAVIPALACASVLWFAPPVHPQERAAAPKNSWVFNGKGQKTDQVEIVDASADDALFPININNHWGLMNQDGYIIVYPRFEWTDYSFEGFTRYVQDGKTGFLRGNPTNDNDAREFFIKASFDYADRFADGCAVVMNKDKWGMIDKSGKLLVPMEFDGVLRMQDGFAGVEKDGRCGFVNRAGRLKIPLQFKSIRSFHNGYAAVQFGDDRWGYIDKRGKVVWEDKSGRVKMLGDFHEDYARVQGQAGDTLKWGYITKAFRFRIDPSFEDARDFHNGMAAVKHQGKWGFITAAKRWAVDPVYDEVDDFDDAVHSGDFEEGKRERDERVGRDLSTASLYAMVKRDGRWGYINRVANAGLEPQFKWAEPFFRGLARVERDGSFAYVGETGKVRFDPRVAVRLGFVDLTSKEDSRVDVAQRTVRTDIGQQGTITRNLPADLGIANRVYEAPEARQAARVPYVSEYAYEEMLPVEAR